MQPQTPCVGVSTGQKLGCSTCRGVAVPRLCRIRALRKPVKSTFFDTLWTPGVSLSPSAAVDILPASLV